MNRRDFLLICAATGAAPFAGSTVIQEFQHHLPAKDMIHIPAASFSAQITDVVDYGPLRKPSSGATATSTISVVVACEYPPMLPPAKTVIISLGGSTFVFDGYIDGLYSNTFMGRAWPDRHCEIDIHATGKMTKISKVVGAQMTVA